MLNSLKSKNNQNYIQFNFFLPVNALTLSYKKNSQVRYVANIHYILNSNKTYKYSVGRM